MILINKHQGKLYLLAILILFAGVQLTSGMLKTAIWVVWFVVIYFAGKYMQKMQAEKKETYQKVLENNEEKPR